MVGTLIFKDAWPMAEEDKNKQLYTMPVDYAIDLIAEAEEQVECTTDLYSSIQEDNFKEYSSYITPIVVEILWSNFSILKILNLELQEPVMHFAEETKEEEYILLEETILKLQTLLLARYYANKDLNQFSFSVSVN